MEIDLTPVFKAVKKASRYSAQINYETRQKILLALANLLEQSRDEILLANAADLNTMSSADSKYDRLLLNEIRVNGLAKSLRDVSNLPAPDGKIILEKHLTNGLQLQKTTAPLGVIGVIYEARPNVTIDVFALCFMAGNAVILKGSKEAHSTNTILVQLIHSVLKSFSLPENLVELLPSERNYVHQLLVATKFVDVIIPRGSEALIQFVRKNALVPTIETGAGVVHIYVHEAANLEKALEIVFNAKTSRPSVCNALDCLLVDEKIASIFLPIICEKLQKANVVIKADTLAKKVLAEKGIGEIESAEASDFGMEWLGLTLSVKLVNGIDEALSHIDEFSSRHSEGIVSEDENTCELFLQHVDAAAVYANASTRFTDGGEFGLGAEIGISTQKLHARGPFALEKLVTEKWIVRGNGQIR